jgi:hypothetical protein
MGDVCRGAFGVRWCSVLALALVGCGGTSEEPFGAGEEPLGSAQEALQDAPNGAFTGPATAVGFFANATTFKGCSAVLVLPNKFLTSAHCACGAKAPTPATPRHTFSPSIFSSFSSKLIDLQSLPGYTCGETNPYLDLAVGTLETPVPADLSVIGGFHGPIPAFLDKLENLDTADAIVVGYGLGASPGIPRAATVHPTNFGNFWTGSRSGPHLEEGDSGGGLLFWDRVTRQHVVAGINMGFDSDTDYWTSTKSPGREDWLAVQLGREPDFELKNVAVMSPNGSVKLNDRVKVRPSATSTGPLVVAAGQRVELGASSQINASVFSRGVTAMRSFAVVDGNVRAWGGMDSQRDSFIRGATQYGGYVRFHELPVSKPVESVFTSNNNYVLEPGQTCASAGLPSQIIGDLRIARGATCRLKGGVYFVRSITIEPGGVLEIDPVSTVIHSKSLTLRGTLSSSAAKLVLLVWGPSLIEAPFSGTLFGLGGPVIMSPFTYNGAFFGQSIEVHQGATINHVPTETGILD